MRMGGNAWFRYLSVALPLSAFFFIMGDQLAVMAQLVLAGEFRRLISFDHIMILIGLIFVTTAIVGGLLHTIKLSRRMRRLKARNDHT